MVPSATRAITTIALIIRPAHRARCKVIVSGTICRFIVSDTCHSPMGGSHIRSLLCLLGMINTEEMNSLFSLWGTIPRHENAESRTHPHIHNGSGNGELHPRGR